MPGGQEETASVEDYPTLLDDAALEYTGFVVVVVLCCVAVFVGGKRHVIVVIIISSVVIAFSLGASGHVPEGV